MQLVTESLSDASWLRFTNTKAAEAEDLYLGNSAQAFWPSYGHSSGLRSCALCWLCSGLVCRVDWALFELSEIWRARLLHLILRANVHKLQGSIIFEKLHCCSRRQALQTRAMVAQYSINSGCSAPALQTVHLDSKCHTDPRLRATGSYTGMASWFFLTPEIEVCHWQPQ